MSTVTLTLSEGQATACVALGGTLLGLAALGALIILFRWIARKDVERQTAYDEELERAFFKSDE